MQFDVNDFSQRELERARDRLRAQSNLISAGYLPPLPIRHVTTVIRVPYVSVTAKVGTGPASITGVGFAKCAPNDMFDPSVGISIAAFRAVRDLLQ